MSKWQHFSPIVLNPELLELLTATKQHDTKTRHKTRNIDQKSKQIKKKVRFQLKILRVNVTCTGMYNIMYMYKSTS
jgi:transposase-like protein